MSIIVTPQPNNVPPRVRIDISTDDVNKPFTTLMVLRDGRPVREQPFVGSSSVVVFDYEAPFGASLTYSFTGKVATLSTVYSEAWSSLSGWTTLTGSPSVTGSHLSGGSVTRPLAFPAEGRLTSQGLIPSGGFGARIVFGGLDVANYNAGGVVDFGAGPKSITGLGSPFSIIWDANLATITTTTGTFVVLRATGSGFGDGSLRAYTADTTSVEDFTIQTPTLAALDGTTPATLHVDSTWLIHPSQPSLSCQIDTGDESGDTFIEAASGDAKDSDPQATILRPIGRKKAVVITSGPRQADEWSLVIGAETIVAKNAVRAIVDDQTPLLLRSPVSRITDLPDDWYSVGKVSTQRPETPSVDELTYTTLPLIPVDEPVVRQGALWTSGSVLLAYATSREVLDGFDSALDLFIGDAS